MSEPEMVPSSPATVSSIARMPVKQKVALAPKPDGLLDEKLTQLFGHSYRTTVSGWLSTGLGIVIAVGQVMPGVVPPPVMMVASTALPIIMGTGLTLTKEARVSGSMKR